jgi:hypothetical protein
MFIQSQVLQTDFLDLLVLQTQVCTCFLPASTARDETVTLKIQTQTAKTCIHRMHASGNRLANANLLSCD